MFRGNFKQGCIHMSCSTFGQTIGGGETMEHRLPEYLCLSDLLDQDLSAYEYFQTLSPEVRSLLEEKGDGIGSFQELQAYVSHLWG